MRFFFKLFKLISDYFRAKREARAALKLKRRKARLSARRTRDKKRAISLAALWQASRGAYVIADLETTGLSAKSEILEIAAILVDSTGTIAAQFSTLVKVKHGIPSVITQLTGISQGKVNRDGISLRAAMTEFLEFAGARPILFHNAPFDTRFLKAAAARLALPFENTTHCTLSMARTVWPHLKTHKLAVLAKYIGAPAPTHRGLADVKATLSVLLAARAEANASLAAAA
jgi:DNA polymerase III alpha subunit (gram-positive type)